MTRWLPWMALAVVLAVALAVGASRRGSTTTEAARVTRITSEIRCPTCRGLSAAESDAKTAQAIRTEVAREVHEGRSDAQIEAYMADRYGQDILLRPPSSGLAGLVWVLPVVALVIAIAGLTVAFRRWRTV
jgi:cytochrome c-type biogenesis protein CcmH